MLARPHLITFSHEMFKRRRQFSEELLSRKLK